MVFIICVATLYSIIRVKRRFINVLRRRQFPVIFMQLSSKFECRFSIPFFNLPQELLTLKKYSVNKHVTKYEVFVLNTKLW